MWTILSIAAVSCGLVSCAPSLFNYPAEQGRYLGGDWGNGQQAQTSNDAEMGQLNGIYNALINELQTAPKLAEGPQAKNKGNGDPQLPAAIADSQPVAPVDTATQAPPTVTDAPPETVTPDMRQKPLTNNNVNRFPPNNGNFENFNPPQPNFDGPNFNQGPAFNQGPPNPGSLYFPPPGLQSPFGQGPYGGQGPYDQGGYGNGYQDMPPPTRAPQGNPNSYGADNSQLQEMGMGQLGQFFSAMVGELQNAGFNNDKRTAIAAKTASKATTTTTTTTKAAPVVIVQIKTATSKTTKASDDDE